ncbi:MAG: hypothetical protein GTO03_00280, partial [Planctomycetales bacterium]|nr:hypothetical protein [Planctomycetales bacterium]
RLRTRIAGRYGDGATRAVRPLFRQALYVYQQHVPTQEAAAALPAAKPPAHEGERCAEQCRQPQVGQ